MNLLSKRQEKLLADNGWTVISTQPLHIVDKIGSCATKIAAAMVLVYLQEHPLKKKRVSSKTKNQQPT
jgi:hypothetical protein